VFLNVSLLNHHLQIKMFLAVIWTGLGFFSNLGIEIEEVSREKKLIVFSNCPWENEARYSPMFCLIYRIIVIRSFTWTSLQGHVEHVSCMVEGSKGCAFQFVLSENPV